MYRSTRFRRLTTSGVLILLLAASAGAQQRFTLEQVKSYPYPTQLTAAPAAARIAWAFNEKGRRNIWVAEAPDFRARQLTNYNLDDGQELSSLSLSPDGSWIVYIRGGDFGSNFDDALPVNPSLSPTPAEVEIWAAPFEGGDPKRIGRGESPVISRDGRRIAFTRERQIWVAPGAPSGRSTCAIRGTRDCR